MNTNVQDNGMGEEWTDPFLQSVLIKNTEKISGIDCGKCLDLLKITNKKPPSGEPKEGFEYVFILRVCAPITSFRPCRHPFHRPLVA